MNQRICFLQDANGRISSSELHDVLRRLGDQDVSDEQIDDLIREIDLDGDGLVDYEGNWSIFYNYQSCVYRLSSSVARCCVDFPVLTVGCFIR